MSEKGIDKVRKSIDEYKPTEEKKDDKE